MQYESVQLFVERAIAAQPRFTLTERNALAVSRICQRLDGIPLALELAASRVQVFTPEQIAARLDDRFRLLTGGSRTALHRQQTLRALIDWSYDMLSAEEQALFRQLSVFSGGWTYDAAEAVCSEMDVLDLLTNLVNKSLVIVNDQDSEARYGFLETIRQYARDKLFEMGEARQARDRHLDYYLRFSQDTDLKIVEPEAIEWLDSMDLEAENIRSAIEWGLETRPVDALALIGNLYLYFDLRGNLRETERLTREALFQVEQFLHTGEPVPPAHLRVKARGLAALGMLTMSLGEITLARPFLEESVAIARALQDPLIVHFAMGMLAHAFNLLNQPEAAKQTAEENLAISRQRGIRWALAMSLGTLAWAEGRLGNDARRAELLQELREMIVAVDSPIMFDAQMMMGIEARAHGDLANARILLEQCLNYLPVLRSRPFEGMVRSELAHITRQLGDFRAAKEDYCQTLQLWIDLGHIGAIAHQLECFAFMARAEEQFSRSARLLGAAEALREGIHGPMTDYERSEYERELSLLRAALPDPTFSKEWSAGRAMSMEEAVAYAIEE
jgi:tetratricopeptide (TPR) repeat protein